MPVCVIWRRCSVLLKHARRNSAQGALGLLSGQRPGHRLGQHAANVGLPGPAQALLLALLIIAAARSRKLNTHSDQLERPEGDHDPVRVASSSSTGSSRAFARTAEATSGATHTRRSRGRRAPRGAAGSAPAVLAALDHRGSGRGSRPARTPRRAPRRPPGRGMAEGRGRADDARRSPVAVVRREREEEVVLAPRRRRPDRWANAAGSAAAPDRGR